MATPKKILLGQGGPFAQTRVDFNLLHGTDSSSGTNPFTSPTNLNDGNAATHADRAADSTPTPVIVQKASAASGAGNMFLDFAAAVTAGNLLYLLNSRRNGGPAFPTGFTAPLPEIESFSGRGFGRLGYKVAAGTEQHLIFGNDQGVATMYEISGAGSPAGFEILSATLQSSGTARSLGAFTTPGGLQLAEFLTDNTTADQTAGSGYTEDYESPSNAGSLEPDVLHESGTTGANPTSSGTAYAWGGLAVGITTSHADTTSICQADLGAAYPVNRVTLLEAAATGTQYALSYSTDGSSWTTLSPTFSAAGALQTYELASTIVARYWRLTDNHSPAVALAALAWDTWTIEGFPF